MDTKTETMMVNLLKTLKTRLTSDDFLASHRRSQKDFTRKRCLTFIVVILFLLNMIKRSLQDELDEFFKLLNQDTIAARIVTKSAFTQARKKLKYEAFVELNAVQIAYFYEHFEYQTWHGFRLLAVDGSTSQLPRNAKISAHFGVWHPAQGEPCPLARISQLYDVLNDLTLETRISPKATGEREHAALHFEHIGAGDLVLLDRGYPAFWLFTRIRSKRARFCARMPLDQWKVVDNFLASGLPEQIVALTPSHAACKQCRARSLSTKPLKVRLVRIELDSGETEVLCTSLLDTGAYPHAVFKELYHQRWAVEEGFKVVKCRLEVENFSGKSVLSVYQDFHAKVFTMNLTSILAQPAQEQVKKDSHGKKYSYQINMTQALSKMKDTVILLFQHVPIVSFLRQLWQLMRQTIEPIRPGRKYPHKKRVKPRKFSMVYKPIR